jgi:acetyltransferase-like isoleucine patch superfamily enzyme
MIVEETAETFRFKMTMALQQHLADLGVYFSLQPKTYRLRDGDILHACKGPVVEPFVIYNANSIFPAGFASYTNANLEPQVSVGRYCSIAHVVRVMGADHPIDRVSTNSFTYGRFSNIHLNPVERLGGAQAKVVSFKQKPFPVIEHDVWIGQDVLLARGITLGTGCIVAAGSVVTKTVAPYAIVGGNPAKLIRYRFPEALIERLLRSQWWRYAFPHFAELPFDRPDDFLDQLERLVQDGKIAPYEPEKLDIYRIVKEFGAAA